MTDQRNTQSLGLAEAPEIQERRAFLRGLGKWSQVVIGGVLLGGGLTVSQRASAAVTAAAAGLTANSTADLETQASRSSLRWRPLRR